MVRIKKVKTNPVEINVFDEKKIKQLLTYYNSIVLGPPGEGGKMKKI